MLLWNGFVQSCISVDIDSDQFFKKKKHNVIFKGNMLHNVILRTHQNL